MLKTLEAWGTLDPDGGQDAMSSPDGGPLGGMARRGTHLTVGVTRLGYILHSDTFGRTHGP